MQRAAAKVYTIDPLRDPRWAGLVESHAKSSAFHSTSWLQSLRRVYAYEPVGFTTCAPGDPLNNAVVCCRIRSWLTGKRLVSLPFSDHCEPLIDDGDDLHDILLTIKQEVDEKKWEYAEIRPISQTSALRSCQIPSYQLHRLQLRGSEKEIFHAFHRDCVQRKIRRAEREGLKYEAGNSEVLLRRFYELQVATRRRHGLPPQPLNWFRTLLDAFGEGAKIRMAFKVDVPVASILTLRHKRSMVYKYGCSDAAMNRFGGIAFLFWKTIQEAKSFGLEEFDMGRSTADNAGLVAFKERFGAVGTPLGYWRYQNHPANPDAFRPWRTNFVQRAVAVSPKFALKAVGTILYKHIG